MLRFTWRKQEYVIPIMLILKALVGASDKEIFEGVIMQDQENTFLTDRVELLLRSFKGLNVHTGEQCLEYLGDRFRVVLGVPEDWTNAALGVWLIQKMVLVHLDSPRDKFRMLLLVPLPNILNYIRSTSGRFMLRKLYTVVSGACCADNPDSVQHQEVLLPGSLYGMIIKERLEEALMGVRNQIGLDVRREDPAVNFVDSEHGYMSSQSSLAHHHPVQNATL